MANREQDPATNPYSFEGNRRAQLLRFAEATPLERLEWLESAMEMAYAAGALPRRDIREFLERRKSEAAD